MRAPFDDLHFVDPVFRERGAREVGRLVCEVETNDLLLHQRGYVRTDGRTDATNLALRLVLQGLCPRQGRIPREHTDLKDFPRARAQVSTRQHRTGHQLSPRTSFRAVGLRPEDEELRLHTRTLSGDTLGWRGRGGSRACRVLIIMRSFSPPCWQYARVASRCWSRWVGTGVELEMQYSCTALPTSAFGYSSV